MNLDIAKNFLGAYFHQDWLDEADSELEVVHIYMEQNIDDVELQELAEQLDVIAEIHENSADQKWLLNEYGCYHMPTDDNFNGSDWVRYIARLIREQAAHAKAPN